MSLDTQIAIRFSAPVAQVSGESVTLSSPSGALPARIVSAEGGRLLFIAPIDPLQPATEYVLSANGVVTMDGRPVAPATISWATAGETRTDTPAVDGERAIDRDASGRPVSPWQSLPPLKAPPGVTAVAGQVLQSTDSLCQG